jgi:hypothetical protein
LSKSRLAQTQSKNKQNKKCRKFPHNFSLIYKNS